MPTPTLKRSRVPVNCTVPWELKQQMKARPDINWSRVAESAFIEALRTPHRDIIHVGSKKHVP